MSASYKLIQLMPSAVFHFSAFWPGI